MRLLHSAAAFLLTTHFVVADTHVRIAGMKSQSEDQALELLGGRLEHVTSRDASASRADDAAFLLRQVLRKDGYAGLQVDWKVVNRSEILLTVQEGTRLALGDVTVGGVPLAEARKLAKLFANPAQKDRPLVSSPAPFREEDVATGLSYIRQELNAQGYWEAEAAISKRANDPASGKVNLSIDVRPGVLHLIGLPRIASPDGRGVEHVKETAEPFVGRPATTGNLNTMRAKVEDSFNRKGYPDAKISMSRSLKAARFIPEFFIVLGKRVHLDHVHAEGLVRTNPARINSRMKALEGEWYDQAAMNKRIRGLLASGAFSSARLETEEVSADRIDATLHLEEAKAREFTAAVGADSYQGPILRTTYADRNFMGELLGFSTGFEFSGRGVLGETKLTDPWLFGADISATARVYALIYGREGYSTFESGAEGKVTWKITDHYSLDLLAGYSLVNVSEEGLPVAALGETVYYHPRINLTQALDFRDSAVLPTSGWHLESSMEVGAAIGGLSTTYFKTGLRGGWYHKLNADYQLAVGGEWGLVIPSGDGHDLPIDLRLFNGGSRTVRSFPERQLGPTADTYATGGEASWSTNAELIRRLSGTLSAVAFLDAGSLSRKYDRITSSDIELAIGLGLRLNLPIGPIRLEYGYNLTQDPGDPIGTLHFAIGMTF